MKCTELYFSQYIEKNDKKYPRDGTETLQRNYREFTDSFKELQVHYSTQILRLGRRKFWYDLSLIARANCRIQAANRSGYG